MGSPVVPLMANAFMCIIEERLQDQVKMPNFYKRYVDDTFSVMPNVEIGEAFLSTLNDSDPLITFIMEMATNGKLSLSGGVNRETHVPPTDTELLLPYQSHVDGRYKESLLKPMLNRAFKLSSNWQLFHLEHDVNVSRKLSLDFVTQSHSCNQQSEM